MDIIKAFENNNAQMHITIRKTNSDILFRASDIGEILDIASIRSTIRDFDSTEKVICNILTPGGHQNILFLTEKGLKHLLCKSRKPNSIKLAKNLGINLYDSFFIPIETSIVKCIKEIYKSEEIIEQYNVDQYKIDLYFKKHNIAIECDEFAHNFTIEEDKLREEYIKEKISGIVFIRFKQSKTQNIDNFSILLNNINNYLKKYNEHLIFLKQIEIDRESWNSLNIYSEIGILKEENTQLKEENTKFKEQDIQLKEKNTKLKEKNTRLKEKLSKINNIPRINNNSYALEFLEYFIQNREDIIIIKNMELYENYVKFIESKELQQYLLTKVLFTSYIFNCVNIINDRITIDRNHINYRQGQDNRIKVIKIVNNIHLKNWIQKQKEELNQEIDSETESEKQEIESETDSESENEETKFNNQQLELELNIALFLKDFISNTQENFTIINNREIYAKYLKFSVNNTLSFIAFGSYILKIPGIIQYKYNKVWSKKIIHVEISSWISTILK